MRHLEDFTADTIATLRAGLPASLAVINAEQLALGSHEIKIPADGGGDVGTTGVSYSDGTTAVLGYPHVEVAIPDGLITNPDLHWESALVEYVVIVRALYQDPLDSTRLGKSLQRYSAAILNVLLADDAFGPHETVSSVRVAIRTSPETEERVEVTGGVLHRYTVSSIIIPRDL